MNNQTLKICYSILSDNVTSDIVGLEAIHTIVQSIRDRKVLDKAKPFVSKIKSICKDVDLDSIFSYSLSNENLAVIKEYSKYYYDKPFQKWLLSLVKIDSNMSIFDGNVKINSFLEGAIKISKKCYGLQTNPLMMDILQPLQPLQLINNDILIEDIKIQENNSFDLIFFDFPDGIKNLIHANCCQRIKKLKIRGTKSEPLLLQLVMSALNPNGKAILIVPDSLLFSDSVQPIETRKYLLENFNVKKIVELKDKYAHNRSLIIFENNGTTSSVTINDYQENHIMDISKDRFVANNYSLYYKNYMEIAKPVVNNTYKKVDDIFIISDILTKTNKVLVLDKYHKNENSLQIVNNLDMILEDNKIYIVSKDNNDFQLYLLKAILIRDINHFVKGKMEQFDLSKIKDYDFPILSKQIQENIMNYLLLNDKIIMDNTLKLKEVNDMKQVIVNSIHYNETIELGKICNIYQGNDYKKTLIGIIRNGSSAGTVYLPNNSLSLNSHYLEITNTDYSLQFVYHWLRCNEGKIKQLANLTSQPNLNRSNLLSLSLPIIDSSKQIVFSLSCDDFDILIEKYTLINNTVKNKDIFSIINKLSLF